MVVSVEMVEVAVGDLFSPSSVIDIIILFSLKVTYLTNSQNTDGIFL